MYKLDAVPVLLRFDGWVTELQNATERQQLNHAAGIDNLLQLMQTFSVLQTWL